MILDDSAELKHNSTTKFSIGQFYFQHRQLIPLLVLSYFVGESLLTILTLEVNNIGETSTSHYILNYQQIFGFCAVVLNYIIYFINRLVFRFTVLITLLLGLGNVLTFTLNQHKIKFGLTGIAVFDYAAFLGMAAFVVLNLQSLLRFYNSSDNRAKTTK